MRFCATALPDDSADRHHEVQQYPQQRIPQIHLSHDRPGVQGRQSAANVDRQQCAECHDRGEGRPGFGSSRAPPRRRSIQTRSSCSERRQRGLHRDKPIRRRLNDAFQADDHLLAFDQRKTFVRQLVLGTNCGGRSCSTEATPATTDCFIHSLACVAVRKTPSTIAMTPRVLAQAGEGDSESIGASGSGMGLSLKVFPIAGSSGIAKTPDGDTPPHRELHDEPFPRSRRFQSAAQSARGFALSSLVRKLPPTHGA